MNINVYPIWQLVEVVRAVIALVVIIYCLYVVTQTLDAWIDKLGEDGVIPNTIAMIIIVILVLGFAYITYHWFLTGWLFGV